MATWNVEHNYCQHCKNLHRERNDKPACQKGLKKFSSRIEALETNSEKSTLEVETNYCEVIQDKIFHLTTSNQLAFDVVSLAHQISHKQHYEFSKNKQKYSALIPSLTNIELALQISHPQDFEPFEIQELMDKIIYIHNNKINQIVS